MEASRYTLKVDVGDPAVWSWEFGRRRWWGCGESGESCWRGRSGATRYCAVLVPLRVLAFSWYHVRKVLCRVPLGECRLLPDLAYHDVNSGGDRVVQNRICHKATSKTFNTSSTSYLFSSFLEYLVGGSLRLAVDCVSGFAAHTVSLRAYDSPLARGYRAKRLSLVDHEIWY